MTQKHFRKAAGMGWLSRAWSRLHEPRIISAVYGAAYAVASIVGLWALASPPRSLEGAAGVALTALIAGAIAIGGLLGVVTVAWGIYWMERTAVYLQITGLTFWSGLTIYLQIVGEGNRGFTIMAALVCIGFYGLRFHWIGDRPYNPRIHPSAGGIDR